MEEDEEENVKKSEEEEEEEDEAEGEQEPPPPPRPEQEKELLFLIEFLVDTLTIIPENMNTENIDPCALQGPASITLSFLHFPPMLISEKDLDPNRVTGTNVIQFNAGKSLMFALTESQFEEPPPVYLIITAQKEMPHAFRIPQVLIGKAKLQLSELFKQVFDKYDEYPDKTVSKSIKDTYELIGEKSKCAGSVSLYVRLTCMGEKILTEFETANCPQDPIMFKNKESERAYECKETQKPEDTSGRVLPQWEAGQKGTEVCNEISIPEPEPDPANENLEEIFASINGNVIVINSEKSKRKEKPREFHVNDFCDCNIPLPQHLVAGMSDEYLNQMTASNTDFEAKGHVHTEKNVGVDEANKLKFEMPSPGVLSRAGPGQSVSYNVKTCVEGEAHKHLSGYKVYTDNNPEGPPPQLPNDPEKDVFVLKIFKRGRSGKGFSVMEVEFKAPKEKIEPPPKPPYMVERGTAPERPKKDKGRRK